MYQVISSGSMGNAVLYFNSLLIDCGIPYSLIKPYEKDLQLVLISHAHGDHINPTTVHKLAYERPTLRFGIGEWMVPYLKGVRNVDVYEIGKWYNYGSFKIAIGQAYHDIPNCFYRIEKNGYKIFHATDTGHLSGITAKDYDLYSIESNYNEDTVFETIAKLESEGKFAHQKGALNSHLSEQQCNDFFFRNKGPQSKLIRLHETKSFL